MRNEWRRVALGEVAEIFDGPHATPKKTTSGPVFLGIGNLNSGRLDLSNTDHLSEEDFAKWTRRVTPQAGDIVFSYETRLGEAALFPGNLRACLGRRMGLLRPRSGVDPRFLLYAYLGPTFQETIRQKTVFGSTVDRLLLAEMPFFPIEVPDILTQKRIADSLISLDDKIELNRKMNETLEAIARALFKSWFVDFDPVRAKAAGRAPAGMDAATAALFPSEFVDSDLGPIPKGWQTRQLGEMIELAYGKPLKAEDRVAGRYGVYGANGPIGVHNEALVKGPGIVVGRKGNPGVVTWAATDFFPIDTTFYVVRTVDAPSLHFLYFTLRNQDLERLSADSAVPGLNRNVVYPNVAVVPPLSLSGAFTKAAEALLGRVRLNDFEIETLSATRDTLLPKLLSGELRALSAP